MRRATQIGWALAVLASVAIAVRAAEPAAEQLLFGFELDEAKRAFEGPGARSVVKPENYDGEIIRALEVQPNGDFLFRFVGDLQGHETEMAAIRPMRFVQERASQGRYSTKVIEVLNNNIALYPTFRLPRIAALPLCLATPQANPRMPEMLNTMGWFDRAFPRDWSGYDRLRVDVRLENSDVDKLLLEVEDELVEPPVSVTFAPPAPGKWVTLELDLARAVAERKLDMKNIRNIWIRVGLKDIEKNTRELHNLWYSKLTEEMEKRRFVAYVDNVRLCGRDAPSANPVLQGTRSVYTLKLPRVYAVTEHHVNIRNQGGLWCRPQLQPAEAKLPAEGVGQAGLTTTAPETVPIKLAPPAVVPIREMIVKGCMKDSPENATTYNWVRLTCAAAKDPQHIVLGFFMQKLGNLRPGPDSEHLAARTGSAAVRTCDGGKSWQGLDGTDYPTVMGGNLTKSSPRLTDLGGDIMSMWPFGCGGGMTGHTGYPADRAFFIRSVFTGQSWVKSPIYFISGEGRHCQWMNRGDVAPLPSGRLWTGWMARNRSSYGHVIPTYSVCAYYSDDGGVSWASWRGAGLSGQVPEAESGFGRPIVMAPYRGQVALLGGKFWTWFDGNKWTKGEPTGAQCWHAVACGDEIYLSDERGPARWYDGKNWQAFTVPDRTGKGGRIGVCSWKTAIFVEPDAGGKKLLCWRKPQGGAWQGPQTLVTEDGPISQIAIQRYAPQGFLPVAYMCLDEKAPPIKAEERAFYFGGGPYMAPTDMTVVHMPWIKVLLVPPTPGG